MARIFQRITTILLIGLVLTPLLHFPGSSLVQADDTAVGEDEIDEDEEEDDVTVSEEDEEDEDEDEETVTLPDTEEGLRTVQDTGDDDDEDEEEEEEDLIGPSSDGKTIVIFTNRETDSLIAGEVVNSLIGFTNIGKTDFIVTGIEASLRYPQDFSYYIQNFSMVYYELYIPPETEASFVYSFKPSETLYARPFGLVMNLYYKDDEGNEFRDSVFNNTVNIVEIEEGFDAETFFMYIFMASGLCLLMFVVHYVWTTFRRGGRPTLKKSTPVEVGTQRKKNNVDYSWIPEGSLPKKSPRNQSSPRNKQKSKPLSTPSVD